MKLTSRDKSDLGYTALIVFLIGLVAVSFSGWVTHIIWTFHQTTLANLVLGVLGAFLGPVGALHGIYLWF